VIESALPARPVVRVGTAQADDGDLLHYRADGSGPRVLLCSNGIGVSTFFWRGLADFFAPTHTVITWDYRGHGQSPIASHPDQLTVARCARDLWAVADRLGAHEAVLIAHSMGCQVSLEAFRLHPSRVRGFVPMLGAPGKAFASFVGGERLLPLVRLLLEVGARNPQLAGQLLRRWLALPGLWQAMRALGIIHPDLCPREEFEPYFAHLAALDLRGYFSLARDLLTHDASDLLPQLRVPTLVVGGERDLFAPVARSREMAAAIPGAELLVLREGSHAALVEQPELLALSVEKFLRANRLA